MKKKKKSNSIITAVIVVLIILCALGAIIFYTYNSTKTVYNELSNANGNTAGNLQNGGYFCELDDKVYFRNPFDKGKLYVMEEDGKTVKKLNDETISSLNVYGKYLYFSKNNQTSANSISAFRGTLYAVMRCDLNGGNLVNLCDKPAGTTTLIGNKVYFQRYENNDERQTLGALYSVGIDGADLKELDDIDINTAGVFGSYIFYAGTEKDHNIYRFNAITDSKSTFYEGNCYMCVPDGHDLYFLDADNEYTLNKTSTSVSKSEAELVIDERIATYNVDSNYIYFQIDDEEGKLCRMKKNGTSSDYEVIAEGHYEHINVTSDYIYFYKLNDTTDMYRIPSNGAATVEKLSEVFDMSIYEK